MLTVIAIKNAKPGAKDRKLSDTGGLFLLITPMGGKLWRMKYRYGGTEKKLSFGRWPEVSLQHARRQRDEARLAIADGRDPAREKKLAKQATKAPPGQTFGVIGREFLDKRRKEGLAETTLKKKEWLLNILQPELGSRSINEISSQDMFAILDKVQQDRRETARRLRSLASEVFNFATATGRGSTNPTEPLKRALMSPKVRHMPAIIEVEALKKLMIAIDGTTGYPSTIGALRISPHLFQRPGEIRKMKWANLDLGEGRWSVPVEDMKKRRPHEVPLSRQAIAIIREMELVRNGIYVFPAFHTGQRPSQRTPSTTH